MRILITGGCGFVRSSVARKIKIKHPQYDVVCLDNLKRRGSEINLHDLLTYEVNFIHCDIRNEEDLDQVGAVALNVSLIYLLFRQTITNWVEKKLGQRKGVKHS